MSSPFSDRTYLWVVWQRGDKASDVRAVLGLYKSRSDALFEAQRAAADGMTPIKDKIVAAILTLTNPELIERPLRSVATAAQ